MSEAEQKFSEKTYDTIAKMEFKTYRNSRVIDTVDGYDFTVTDALKAAIISRSNIFLLSRSGPGKTQIENDILYGMFGGKGVQLRGDLNVDVKSLYTSLNLEALRNAKSSEDAEQLTERVSLPVVIMDEYNRAPAQVQHQFFNVADGYILHLGKMVPLGKGGYSIGIASGNLSNGDYSGVFETDRALIDRAHVILDLDHYYKTAEDGWTVLEERDDPRVKCVGPTDLSKEIEEAWLDIKGQKGGPERMIAGLFLEYGLDYCSNIPGNSKRDNHVRGNGGENACNEKGALCDYLRPATTRQVLAWTGYSKGVEAVMAAKKKQNVSQFDSLMAAIKVAAPHSGMLDPAWVQNEHGGSYCRAMDGVMDYLRREFQGKGGDIIDAVSQAQAGKLEGKTLDRFEAEWYFVRPKLQSLNAEYGGGKVEVTAAPATQKVRKRKAA